MGPKTNDHQVICKEPSLDAVQSLGFEVDRDRKNPPFMLVPKHMSQVALTALWVNTSKLSLFRYDRNKVKCSPVCVRKGLGLWPVPLFVPRRRTDCQNSWG